MKKTFAFFTLLAGLVALSGCGGVEKPAGMPDLVKAQITITQDNKPLADAYVKLDGAMKEWPVFGKTDANGVAILQTYKSEYVGAPEGEYTVSVDKVRETPSEFDGVVANGMEELMALDAKKKAEFRPSYYLVDRQYASFDSSPLKVSITSAGANPATLDVGAAVEEEFIPPGSAPRPGMEAKIPAEGGID